MFINNNCALLRGAFMCIEFDLMGASFQLGSRSGQALQVLKEA
jgi:hypothetical protein